jgi:hypothetical protein
MPTKNDLFPSKYYNSQDVRRGPFLLTIDFVRMESIGQGASKQEKAVIYFKETNSKQLVLTSDETEEWGGVQIVFEAGKTQFQGKLVDTVVIKAPRTSKRAETESPPSAPPKPTASDVDAQFDDEIGF